MTEKKTNPEATTDTPEKPEVLFVGDLIQWKGEIWQVAYVDSLMMRIENVDPSLNPSSYIWVGDGTEGGKYPYKVIRRKSQLNAWRKKQRNQKPQPITFCYDCKAFEYNTEKPLYSRCRVNDDYVDPCDFCSWATPIKGKPTADIKTADAFIKDNKADDDHARFIVEQLAKKMNIPFIADNPEHVIIGRIVERIDELTGTESEGGNDTSPRD